MSGETHLDFTAKSDGHETSVAGNPAFNQIELRRIDKKQAEVKEKKDGAVVATVREKLSNDGNELTITTASTGHADQITVWTRSGGAKKVAGDLFAGEWTQDLSKTRLRQGLLLKIEADGSGGVRFSGEFSYTARFDGKQYDLKNSRNDTVTLATCRCAHGGCDLPARRSSDSKGQVGGFRRWAADDAHHHRHVGNRPAHNREAGVQKAVADDASVHARGAAWR